MDSYRISLRRLAGVGGIWFLLLFVSLMLLMSLPGQPRHVQAAVPSPVDMGTTYAAQAAALDSVGTQLGIILDGSALIDASEWAIQTQGLVAAITSPCFPKDGSIELTVVQIGDMTSRLEVGPVPINAGNYLAIAAQIQAIPKMGGLTPLACGLYRLADTWAATTVVPESRSPTADSGAWAFPTLAYQDEFGAAVGASGQLHTYFGYGFSLPGTAIIEGIEVRVDARRSMTATGFISVELSWDGGTSWTTTGYGTGPLPVTENTYILGGPTNLWGRASWTAAEVNFLRVRVRATVSGGLLPRVHLDWIPVTVYYRISGFDPSLRQLINLATDGGATACCDDSANAYLCLNPFASAENARNYLISALSLTPDRDRITVEAVGSGPLARLWMRNNIVWPQPGQIVDGYPPLFPQDVGWVRPVENANDFVQALFYKLGLRGPITPTISAEPRSGCAPLEVYFTGGATGGSVPYQYHWDFGDGATSTDENPSHLYADGGVYTVTLTVTDACSYVGQVVETEYIEVGTVTAGFNATPGSGCMPLVVNFSDTSTSTAGDIVAWQWDFGDGVGTSTEQNPSYTYNCPGTYTVTLTVTDSLDCSDSYQRSVQASPCFTVTKTDLRDPVCSGWIIRYAIRLQNTSLMPLNGVLVTDTLPDGTYFYGADMGGVGEYGKKVVTWMVNVSGDSIVTLNLQAGTYSTFQGLVTNVVTVTYPGCNFHTYASQQTRVEKCVGPEPQPTPTRVPGTIVIPGGVGDSQDTFIYRYMPKTNYWLNPLLRVGYKQVFASILRFNLSSIPAGAIIDEAKLELFATAWSGPRTDITIGAYAISRTITISETTWTEAYTGDAWSKGGCNDTLIDRRPQPEFILTTSGPRKWYQFDLTALVQDWKNGVMPNNGVLLRQEVYSPFTFFFASSEFPDVNLRPRLVVRYH